MLSIRCGRGNIFVFREEYVMKKKKVRKQRTVVGHAMSPTDVEDLLKLSAIQMEKLGVTLVKGSPIMKEIKKELLVAKYRSSVPKVIVKYLEKLVQHVKEGR